MVINVTIAKTIAVTTRRLNFIGLKSSIDRAIKGTAATKLGRVRIAKPETNPAKITSFILFDKRKRIIKKTVRTIRRLNNAAG
jgi:hypothetical protein